MRRAINAPSAAKRTSMRERAPGMRERANRGRIARFGASLVLGFAAMLALWVPATTALPPGYGYEKVSPNDKDGQDILNGGTLASVDGNAATYPSFGAFDDSQGAGLITQFLSTRGADWTTDSLGPPQAVATSLASSIYMDFSPDLSSSIFSYIAGDPALDGATPGTNNLYRNNTDGSIDLVSGVQPPQAGAFPPAPAYGGGADDMSLAAFSINTGPAIPVTSGPAGVDGVENAYWGNGIDLELVSVLPNDTAAPSGGAVGESGFGDRFNAVSDDGSRIYWSSNTFPREIYVRIDGSSTEHVSASELTPPDPSQTKNYEYATPDGAFAFFSSNEKLTADSTAGGANGPDLYRYDVASGDLVDLTTADPGGGGVIAVLGVSNNGQRVYFVADGALAPGATAGDTNLYLRDGGQTTFITELAPGFGGDAINWSTSFADRNSRVSPDGRFLLFTSTLQQTGFDNDGFQELYLYDAQADDFTCVSCGPGDGPATGNATMQDPIVFYLELSERRNLLPDGTVLFNSPERLVPQDTNGKLDAYRWQNGQLHLISSGESSDRSFAMGASVDGDNLFFLTRERLVGIDTDNSVDLYDARLGGGIAAQNPEPGPVPCQGDECQGPAAAQAEQTTPGSATVDNPPAEPKDCTKLERKAKKAKRKLRRTKRKLRRARRADQDNKVDRLKKQKKRKAKRAKRANRKLKQCRRQQREGK